MKKGILKQIEGRHIQIDTTWYLAKSPQFVPTKLETEVDFDTDPNDSSTVTFIRSADSKSREVTKKSTRYSPRNDGEIRRMSCINSAIAYVASQQLKLNIDEVIGLAEKIETWEKQARE